MTNEAVLKFLEEHNRPFSCNEILSGAKGEFGKSVIQKALDHLVSKDKVKEKVYGKQKVYCIVQNNNVSANALRENLLEIDRKINEKSMQLKEISDKIKTKTLTVSEVKGKISLEDAIDKKIKLEKELENVKLNLEKYSNTEPICPTTKHDIEKRYEKYFNEYKKRKRICMDAINAIAENYPKGKKFSWKKSVWKQTRKWDLVYHVDNVNKSIFSIIISKQYNSEWSIFYIFHK